MDQRRTGFDPNQKRAGNGTWEKQSGARPPTGTLAPSTTEQWPADAWPTDPDLLPAGLPPAEPAAASHDCSLCGRTTTATGEYCGQCQVVMDAAYSEAALAEEEQQMRAAWDRAKQLDSETESPTDYVVRTTPDDASPKLCALCDRPHHAKGLCQHHYDEQRYGTTGITLGSPTPWGPADHVEEIAPGISSIITAGHGGYKLTAERNKMIPAPLRTRSGWYEEDCEWAAVGAIFPEELTRDRPGMTPERMLQTSEESLREWNPDGWEKWKGVTLRPGESRTRDAKQWEASHADQYVDGGGGSPALTDPDMVKVSARRASDQVDAEFLVPKEEYARRFDERPGEYGHNNRFVIDPARHRRLPPAPAEDKLTNTAIAAEDVQRLRTGRTDVAQRRIDADLAQRWRCTDGRVRTMEEILTSDGVHRKTVHVNDAGRSEYVVSQADGSTMRISSALFSALQMVPDSRSESQKLGQQMQRLNVRRDRLSPRDGVKRTAIDAELDRLNSLRKEAAEREKQADIDSNGTYEERSRRRRADQLERELRATITPSPDAEQDAGTL